VERNLTDDVKLKTLVIADILVDEPHPRSADKCSVSRKGHLSVQTTVEEHNFGLKGETELVTRITKQMPAAVTWCE
jgi:hypothetical protein